MGARGAISGFSRSGKEGADVERAGAALEREKAELAEIEAELGRRLDPQAIEIATVTIKPRRAAPTSSARCCSPGCRTNKSPGPGVDEDSTSIGARARCVSSQLATVLLRCLWVRRQRKLSNTREQLTGGVDETGQQRFVHPPETLILGLIALDVTLRQEAPCRRCGAESVR